MNNIGTEKPYKYTEAEGSQICYFNIYLCAPGITSIHLQMHNIVDLSYIVEMWGTHNKVLSYISKEIWDYFLLKGMAITVEHLPGVLNQEADFQSGL